MSELAPCADKSTLYFLFPFRFTKNAGTDCILHSKGSLGAVSCRWGGAPGAARHGETGIVYPRVAATNSGLPQQPWFSGSAALNGRRAMAEPFVLAQPMEALRVRDFGYNW